MLWSSVFSSTLLFALTWFCFLHTAKLPPWIIVNKLGMVLLQVTTVEFRCLWRTSCFRLWILERLCAHLPHWKTVCMFLYHYSPTCPLKDTTQSCPIQHNLISFFLDTTRCVDILRVLLASNSRSSCGSYLVDCLGCLFNLAAKINGQLVTYQTHMAWTAWICWLWRCSSFVFCSNNTT
jgi:hypothetical protein